MGNFINSVFTGGIIFVVVYAWTLFLIFYLPLPHLYILSIFYLTALLVSIIAIKRLRLAAFLLLLYSYFPLVYIAFTDPGLTYSVFILTAVFSVTGLVPGLLLISSKDILNKLGISLVMFNIIFNLILEIFTGASIVNLAFISPMSITSALIWAHKASEPTAFLSPNAIKRSRHRVATVVFKGLPQGCQPTVYLKGKPVIAIATPQGDYMIELSSDATLTLGDVVCYGVIYAPDVRRVRATVGNVVVVNFRPTMVT